jgi:hypothetical protein
MNTDYQDIHTNNSQPELSAGFAVPGRKGGSGQAGSGSRYSDILAIRVSVKICVPTYGE